MGSTNSTVNYSLSQFIGTDKPSWLNDYDNDMFKIDAQMKLNATAAAGAKTTADTADGKADANALAISTLDSQINTAGTGLAANVAANTTAIGTIDGEIGNTPLTTVAQTLTGAIEEVKDSIPSISGTLKYLGRKSFTKAYDSVKSISETLDALFSDIATYMASKGANYRYIITTATPNDASYTGELSQINSLISTVQSSYRFSSIVLSGSPAIPKLQSTTVKASGSTFQTYDFSTDTYADNSATVPTAGTAELNIDEYELN